MKKRILVLLSVALVMAAMALVIAVPSFALPNNPSGKQHSGSGSYDSANCVAFFSAQVIHNGADVRNQTPRGGLVKGQQATCNHANQK
jgi:hypothetical protein